MQGRTDAKEDKMIRRVLCSPARWPGYTRLLSGSRSGPATLLTLPIVVILAGVLSAVVPAPHARAQSCANPIVCENQLQGTPQSVWDVGSDDTNIDGFSDPFSVNVGGTINFKIQSIASYSIDIYRMGYYGGDGARFITSLTPNVSASENQPTCNTNTTTGLVDCGNWSVSATWSVPSTAVSGVYFAHIYTSGDKDENQIPFVVTNNASTSNIVFMTNDTTWQAYNDWGGYSLYTGNASQTANSPQNAGRAIEVSYNRPFRTRYVNSYGQDFFFSMEFPMIEWMEQNGYDVTYVSSGDVDTDTNGQMLSQHKMFMTVGHSNTGQQECGLRSLAPGITGQI